MTQTELDEMTALECNAAKHIAVVNDIFSWEKERRASQTGHQEGSSLCTAVRILAEDTGLGIESSKRVLWSMVREWETTHHQMVLEMIERGCSQASRDYIEGLEYQMSGNESWSQTTPRYHRLD